MAAKSRTRRKKAVRSGNPITVYSRWCKRCGICIAFCPREVLEPGAGGEPVAARPEECVRCHLCELRCPDFAITVEEEEENP